MEDTKANPYRSPRADDVRSGADNSSLAGFVAFLLAVFAFSGLAFVVYLNWIPPTDAQWGNVMMIGLAWLVYLPFGIASVVTTHLTDQKWMFRVALLLTLTVPVAFALFPLLTFISRA